MGQIRLLISTSAQVPGRLLVSLQDHADIIAAIGSGNAAAAEAAMRRHVRAAGAALTAHLAAPHPITRIERTARG
jgi:DNA-binding GntR family transcriptional regulator